MHYIRYSAFFNADKKVEDSHLYKKNSCKFSKRSFGIYVFYNAVWKHHRSIRLEIWGKEFIPNFKNGLVLRYTMRFLYQKQFQSFPKRQFYKKKHSLYNKIKTSSTLLASFDGVHHTPNVLSRLLTIECGNLEVIFLGETLLIWSEMWSCLYSFESSQSALYPNGVRVCRIGTK